MANVAQSFGATHKPTLAWATSISGILIILAVIILVVWVLRRTKAA